MGSGNGSSRDFSCRFGLVPLVWPCSLGVTLLLDVAWFLWPLIWCGLVLVALDLVWPGSRGLWHSVAWFSWPSAWCGLVLVARVCCGFVLVESVGQSFLLQAVLVSFCCQ